ncbi:MAG: flagellar cap protein FliD N-terminal domain-containing protein, partial [Planctomycetota bacterium]
MSGITSSVGLFSGIDTGALIEQLLAIDARPRQLAQQQVAILQARQTAMIAINSSMLGFNSAISSFTTSNVFESSSATSSDTDVLTATAQNRAAAGSYKFIVDRLVSTQQSLSKGFADRDSSSFGATSFTFEGIQGAVSNSTRLTELNGGNGVARGKFDITDRAGNTATIDASKALTLDDVVNAINAQQDILITATVEDGGIKITDNSGGGGNLVIQDQFGRTTAADLGIAGSFASNTVAKADLLTLNDGTALSALRDGLGIMIRDGEGKTDLEITTRDGTKHLINLGLIQQNFVTEDYTSAGVSYSKDDVYTGPPDPEPDGFEPPPIESRITQTRAATVGDLITAIESQTGGDVEVSINAATGTLTFDDLTGETISDFKIEAPSAIDTTANDL